MADWKAEVRQAAGEMTQLPQIIPGEFPDIELYMDQLLTYLDRRLGFFGQGEEGSFVTKAMINNYSKAKLLPPAQGKRYGKDHMMALTLIGQLKRVLPVQEMDKILGQPPQQLEGLYQLFLKAQRQAFDQAPQLAEELLEEAAGQEEWGSAAVVIQLAAEAQMRLLLAQRLLDSQPREPEKKPDKKK